MKSFGALFLFLVLNFSSLVGQTVFLEELLAKANLDQKCKLYLPNCDYIYYYQDFDFLHFFESQQSDLSSSMKILKLNGLSDFANKLRLEGELSLVYVEFLELKADSILIRLDISVSSPDFYRKRKTENITGELKISEHLIGIFDKNRGRYNFEVFKGSGN